MEVTEILENLKEVVTEECYQDILSIIEGLFVDDGRGDLFDGISRATTGGTIKQHMGWERKKKPKSPYKDPIRSTYKKPMTSRATDPLRSRYKKDEYKDFIA